MKIFRRVPALLALAFTPVIACTRGQASKPLRMSVWHVAAPQLSTETTVRVAPGEQLASLGALIAIDSASLRPLVVRRGGTGHARIWTPDSTLLALTLERPVTITTFQATRYHPESIRALANDTVVMENTALAIVRASPGTSMIVDFQGATRNDLPGMVEMVRAIGKAARPIGRGPVVMVVPPGDTVSYPTSVLARVADILMIRLHGEHRPGTAPGPLASPEFIAREIGLRTRIIGASRLGAELPLFGYRWNGDGSAAPITYVDAQALVRTESGVFTRDPSSQFLTARGRDGWTVFVPDAQTIEAMIGNVKRRGISIVALAGPEGADPAIFTAGVFRR